MRPLRHDDLITAAELLAGAARGEQPALARRLIARAMAADRYRCRYGRFHPRWGNGSLMAAALSSRLPRRQGLDCAALALLLSELFRSGLRQPPALGVGGDNPTLLLAGTGNVVQSH